MKTRRDDEEEEFNLTQQPRVGKEVQSKKKQEQFNSNLTLDAKYLLKYPTTQTRKKQNNENFNHRFNKVRFRVNIQYIYN